MALSKVQHVVAADVTSGTTVVATITASLSGSLLVIGCMGKVSLTVSSITDNKSNTYTQVPSARSLSSGGRWSDIWYCPNATSGVTSVTLTVSGTASTNRRDIEVWEVSGAATSSPLDGNGVGLANSVSGVSGAWVDNGASITTTNAADFLASVIRSSGAVSLSEHDTTFTLDDTTADGGYSSAIVSSTGTYTPSLNDAWGGTTPDTAASVAAFKAAGAGGSSWTRSGSATIAPTTTASRLGAFLRSATLTEIMATTASGVKGAASWSRSAAVTVIPSIASSRLAAYLRQRTMGDGQLMGLGFIPSIPNLFAPSSTRAASYLRALGPTLTPLTAATRFAVLLRSLAMTLAPVPAATRLVAYARTLAITEAVSTATSRIQGWVRATGPTIALVTSGVRQATMARSQAATEALTIIGSRLVAYARSQSLTEIMATTASGAKNGGSQAWSRAASLTISALTTANRVAALSRQGQATVAVLPTAARLAVLLRQAQVALSALTTALRSEGFTRLSAVTTIPATTTTRAAALLRSQALTVAPTITAVRQATMTRLQALTEAVSTTASGIKNGGSQSWTRAANLTLSAVTVSSRLIGFTRQDQGTVAPAPAASRTSAYGRQGGLVASASAASGRVIGFARISAMGATVTTTSGRVFGLVRQGGAVLSPTALVSRSLVLSRLAAVQVSATIQGTGSHGFGGAAVSLMAWAASRITKTIRDLINVYVLNQQRAGHTLDTGGNFDAGFSAFSGTVVQPTGFPDSTPPAPLSPDTLGLDKWVAARLHSGNYELVTVFAENQEQAHNEQDTMANYDAAYTTFIQSQEPVPWHH